MTGVIKEFEDLTVSDLVLFEWLEYLEDGKTKYLRGRKRTMEESIALCGGDVKRFMNYARDYEKMTQNE